jgi:endonuclease/exonuclease/phosphatase family metal-dependent hydrolase
MLSILLIVVVLLFFSPGQALAQSSCAIKVASFNVHYIVPSDAEGDWGKRKQAVTDVLKDIDADIVAFQEMETFEGGHYSYRNLQLDWINASTTGYEDAAVGDPRFFPSTQPILYKPSKFTVVDQGFFFFSDTPDKIYSQQWDGRYPYFCSWVRFHSRYIGKDFYLFNVHNDYKSRGNRLKTSQLVANRIRRIVPEKVPVIVLGDFNASKRSEEIRLLKAIGLSVVKPGGGTFRIWGIHLPMAIDHVLFSKEFEPLSKIKVWRDRYDGVYPSDHDPISVKLAIKADGTAAGYCSMKSGAASLAN